MESSSIRTVSPALIAKQVLMESSSHKMENSSVRAAMLLIKNIVQLVRKLSQPTVLSQTATCTMQSVWRLEIFTVWLGLMKHSPVQPVQHFSSRSLLHSWWQIPLWARLQGSFDSTYNLWWYFLQKSKKSCSDCGKLIDGLYYTGVDNMILCELDYKVCKSTMLNSAFKTNVSETARRLH